MDRTWSREHKNNKCLSTLPEENVNVVDYDPSNGITVHWEKCDSLEDGIIEGFLKREYDCVRRKVTIRSFNCGDGQGKTGLKNSKRSLTSLKSFWVIHPDENLWMKLAYVQKRIGVMKPSLVSSAVVCSKIFENDLTSFQLSNQNADTEEEISTLNVVSLKRKTNSSLISSVDRSLSRVSALLKGTVICNSGFASGRDHEFDMKTSLEFAINCLGGSNETNLTESCTHLIVGLAGSPKHCAAIEMNRKSPGSIKIVSKDWIEAIFTEGKLENESKFSVQPLAGLRISITGFKADERNELAEMISRNGGLYEPIFSAKCTYLLAFEPVGEKYQFALKAKVPVVNRDWLLDRLEKNIYSSNNDPRYSVSASMNGQKLTELIQFSTQISLDSSSSPHTFFSKCFITLYGFQQPEFERHLHRLILYGSGFRHSVSIGAPIYPYTTHIIVPIDPTTGKSSAALDTRSTWSLNNDEIPILNVLWLYECCRLQTLVSCKDYLVTL